MVARFIGAEVRRWMGAEETNGEMECQCAEKAEKEEEEVL